MVMLQCRWMIMQDLLKLVSDDVCNPQCPFTIHARFCTAQLAETGKQLEAGDIKQAARTMSDDWVKGFTVATKKVAHLLHLSTQMFTPVIDVHAKLSCINLSYLGLRGLDDVNSGMKPVNMSAWLQFSSPADQVEAKLYKLQSTTSKDELLESKTTFVALVEELKVSFQGRPRGRCRPRMMHACAP